MKRLILLVMVLFLGCKRGPIHGNYGEVDNGAINVSLIQLISSPMAYNSKVVRVSGVIKLEFEGTAIYLTKEHLDNVVTENAIWIDLQEDALFKNINHDEVIHDLKYFNGKYASVEGVFDAASKGHLGLFQGSIRVSRLF